MINNFLNNIYYKQNSKNRNFVLVLFETSTGFYELDNCKLSTTDKINNDYNIFIPFYESNMKGCKIIEIRKNFEMEFFLKMRDNNYITIFRNTNFSTGESFQELNIISVDESNYDFLEYYNESDLVTTM